MEIAKIEFAPQAHSDTGASGLRRWRADHCPGSVNLIRDKAPPELDIDDEVRDDGIEAHGFAERLLTAKDAGARSVLKATFNNNGGDDAMFWGVVNYVDYVNLLASQPNATLQVEQRFKLDWLYEGLWGTADAVVHSPESLWIDNDTGEVHEGSILHVIDFKYGFVAVDAEENDQGLYYALGAYFELRNQGKNVDRIVIHIVQPRAPGRKRAVVTWSCDQTYLEAFALRLKADKIATEDPNAPLRADESWCRLCKGRTVCPKLSEPAYLVLREALREEGMPHNEIPTMAEFISDRALQYKAAKLATVWAKSIQDRTRSEMIAGHAFPGLKLVAPNSVRVLIDRPEIEKEYPVVMYPDIYETPELKSAPQVLEALKKSPFANVPKFEEKYVRKIDTRNPLVADANDKRAAFNGIAKVQNEWADEIAQAKNAQVEATPAPPYLDPAVLFVSLPDFLSKPV